MDVILCSKLSTVIVSPSKASILTINYINKSTAHFDLADAIIEVSLHMWLLIPIFEERRKPLNTTQQTWIFLIVLDESVC